METRGAMAYHGSMPGYPEPTPPRGREAAYEALCVRPDPEHLDRVIRLLVEQMRQTAGGGIAKELTRIGYEPRGIDFQDPDTVARFGGVAGRKLVDSIQEYNFRLSERLYRLPRGCTPDDATRELGPELKHLQQAVRSDLLPAVLAAAEEMAVAAFYRHNPSLKQGGRLLGTVEMSGPWNVPRRPSSTSLWTGEAAARPVSWPDPVAFYSPDQPRAPDGRWTSGGGDGSGGDGSGGGGGTNPMGFKDSNGGKDQAAVDHNAAIIQASPNRRAAAEAYAAFALSRLPPAMQGRAARLERQMNSAMAQGATTEDAYDRAPKALGVYLPERQALHDQIVQGYLDQAQAQNIPQDRQALIMGGLGGSGKTTALRSFGEEITGGNATISVNPDDIKEKLIAAGAQPTVEQFGSVLDGVQPAEESPLLHEESSYLGQQAAQALMARGYNMTWDITMASPGSVMSRLNDLKANGYTTRAAFVDVPVNLAIDRAIRRWVGGYQRALSGEGSGGRYVPPRVIAANASVSGERSRNGETFESLRSHFVHGVKINNSGGSPEIVEQW